MRQRYLSGKVTQLQYPSQLLELPYTGVELEEGTLFIFFLTLNVVHIDNEKHINSTHQLPRNLLHEIVPASWAEILILGLLIDIPHYWFLSLVDHKQLSSWQCVFIENKRKEAGREKRRERGTKC